MARTRNYLRQRPTIDGHTYEVVAELTLSPLDVTTDDQGERVATVNVVVEAIHVRDLETGEHIDLDQGHPIGN